MSNAIPFGLTVEGLTLIYNRVASIMQAMGYEVHSRPSPEIRLVHVLLVMGHDCGGYFDIENDIIYIRAGVPWYIVEEKLAHELCHALQGLAKDTTSIPNQGDYWGKEIERQAYTVETLYTQEYLMIPDDPERISIACLLIKLKKESTRRVEDFSVYLLQALGKGLSLDQILKSFR